MPDPGSKKRPAQQIGSGKLSKKANSIDDIPVIETLNLTETADIDNGESLVSKSSQQFPQTPEHVKDIMRTEPLLYSIIIKKYDGQIDADGFYHGKGTAYLTDGMVYSGMFENGKMHGHGLFTWFDGTTYSGDFVHNNISGNGSYCWLDGSTYDGEVLNGLRHGNGVFKCPDGKTYTGQWKHGKRHGKGILYYDTSKISYYDGEWVENEKRGFGVRRFRSQNTYKGCWKHNLRNGEGTMYWYTRGEEYSGSWVSGLQNGCGKYTWYLKRVQNSQYPLRNQYIGDFLNGERHGNGVFHYASGAMYVGEWRGNMKEGHGKFTFKNGSVFTGFFHNDHMTDFPDLILPRMLTPDIIESGIPVKSSMSFKSKSAVGLTTNAAILDVDLDDIFVDYEYDLEQRQEEIENIMRTILRYTTKLKNIYKIYSCLGMESSIDNTFVMSKFQFSRFIKDYGIHRHGFTLAEMERCLEEEIAIENCTKEIFIREFLSNLVKISYLIFRSEVVENESVISSCFNKFMSHLIINEKVDVQGYIFKSIDHAQQVFRYAKEVFQLYFYFADFYCKGSDVTLRLRDILFIFNEMNLINETFNATELVNILTEEERNEGYFNLDKEIMPYEFLEFVVGSSGVFITEQLLEKYCPTHIQPTSLLNILCDYNRDLESDGSAKIDEATSLVPVSADLSEDSSMKLDSIEPLSISPAKSMKSSGRVSKRLTNEKKIEKETSNVNLKGKRDSKLGKKASSLKMDVGKNKSPKNIASPELDVNAVGAVITNESLESTVEHIPSLGEDVIVPSKTDLTVDSSLDVKTSKKSDDDFEENIEDKNVSFEMWSLRLKLFLNEYLFPRYRKRKMLVETVKNCAAH